MRYGWQTQSGCHSCSAQAVSCALQVVMATQSARRVQEVSPVKNTQAHLQLTDLAADIGDVVALLLAFPSEQASPEALVEQLVALSGEQIQRVIEAVTAQTNPGNRSAPVSSGPEANLKASTDASTTEHWREELMACRARTWPSPDQAGLLVGPHVLILTDGQQGVIFEAAGVRVMARSMSGSLMLLCQTIVMAEHAVNAQDLGNLRQQRIESASTTLSEIQPIE